MVCNAMQCDPMRQPVHFTFYRMIYPELASYLMHNVEQWMLQYSPLRAGKPVRVRGVESGAWSLEYGIR
jgi:hypothetical protein